VRFYGEKENVTLLFSEESNRMMVGELGQAVVLDAKTAAGWKKYLSERLEKK